MDGVAAFLRGVTETVDPTRLLDRYLGEGKQAAPWQRDLIQNAMIPGSSTMSLVCRRAGKSTACATFAAHTISQPNRTCLVLARTMAQSQLLKSATERILALIDLPLKIERQTLDKIYLDNGSELHCLPVGESGDSVRGYGMGLSGGAVICDEAAFVPAAAFDSFLPLTEDVGSLVLVTTPTNRPAGPGIVPAYDIWTDVHQYPDFVRITAPADSLPYMRDKVGRARRMLSAQRFRREMSVEWLAEDGYSLFDSELVDKAFTDTPGLRLGDFYA